MVITVEQEQPGTPPAGASFDALLAPAPAAPADGPRRDRASANDLIKVMLGILIPLIVIFAGLVVAEAVIRHNASTGVRDAVAEAFGVDAAAVRVDLGPDLALVQAVNGQFEEITATVPGVAVDGVPADATITADAVPLDRSQPVGTLTAVLDLPAASVAALVRDSTGFDAATTTLGDGLVTVATTLDLGIVGSFDASVDLRPGSGPGSITLDPVAIELNGRTIQVSQVRELPVIGAFLAPALTAKEVCVADRLPAALQVRRLAVVGDRLRLTVGGTAVPLDPSLATPGTCAG